MTARASDLPRRWRWGDPVAPLRELLAAGGVLAIPTESSYGLAVDPRNRQGVEAVYAIKGRERGKPLPVVAADAAQALALGVERSPRLAAAESLWPAPLTVLLGLSVPLAAAAGGATLAVRVPAHRRLRGLLADLGFAVTATSANRSGEPPILDPRALGPLFSGRPAAIVDDGVLRGGPPSTLIDWTAGGALRILRRGAFPESRLAGVRNLEGAAVAAAGNR